jgi:hypothetical protein
MARGCGFGGFNGVWIIIIIILLLFFVEEDTTI